MSLRKWVTEQKLRESTIKVDGHDFLVVELNLAQRGDIAAKCNGSENFNSDFTDAMMAACICDPEDRQPLCDTWKDKGGKFGPLLHEVLAINGLSSDPVEEQVKD